MFQASRWATSAVTFFVDQLNAHIATPVLSWPPSGQGVARAKLRLEAKRKANKSIPDTQVETRQQCRAWERRHGHGCGARTDAERGRRNMAERNGAIRCAKASWQKAR